MAVSRRAFVRTLARTSAAGVSLAARGREAWIGEHGFAPDQAAAPVTARDAIRLNSNENPLGPWPTALQAIEASFAAAARYPMNSRPAMIDVRAAVAGPHGLGAQNVSLGAGSGEILDNAVRAFTSDSRALVTALPTFETPTRVATALKVPLVEVPVDAAGRLDLEAMVAASRGAGLVFVCNPNNPTGAVHPAGAIADLVARITSASPDTVILIDEAYHEYVTERSYASAVPLVRRHAGVIVSRTMSKLYGMAGLRLGFAIGQARTLERLTPWAMPFNANVPVLAAAIAALTDAEAIERERRRNTAALEFTTRFFRSAGMPTTASQANFVWVDLKRPVREFREACERQGILVGRDFPPFDKTHCRISIGTMDEMTRAVGVFRNVLNLTSTSASRGDA